MSRSFSHTLVRGPDGLDVQVEYDVERAGGFDVTKITAVTPLGMPMIVLDLDDQETATLEIAALEDFWGDDE